MLFQRVFPYKRFDMLIIVVTRWAKEKGVLRDVVLRKDLKVTPKSLDALSKSSRT